MRFYRLTTIDLDAIRKRYEAERGDLEHNVKLAFASANDIPALLSLLDEAKRVVLAVEWINRQCPGCLGCAFQFTGRRPGHEPSCPLDAWLTSIGLPDQAARDAERERLSAQAAARYSP